VFVETPYTNPIVLEIRNMFPFNDAGYIDYSRFFQRQRPGPFMRPRSQKKRRILARRCK